jgi:hypothetical protein
VFQPSSQKKTEEQSGSEPSKRSSESDSRRNPDPRTRGGRRSRSERNSSISDFSPATTESNTEHFTANPTIEETEGTDTSGENGQEESQDDSSTEGAETTPPEQSGDVSLDSADSFDRPSKSEDSLFNDEDESEDADPAGSSADEEAPSDTDLDPEEGLAAVTEMQAEFDSENEAEDDNTESDDNDELDVADEDEDGGEHGEGEENEQDEDSTTDDGEEQSEQEEEDADADGDEEEIDGSPSKSGNEIIPSALERRVSDLEQEVGRIDGGLKDQKEKLNSEFDMQEEKISRVYQELEHYENLVDKREDQIEAFKQILFVICKAGGHPVFDEIAKGLTDDDVSVEDILDESFVEQIKKRESAATEQHTHSGFDHDTDLDQDTISTEIQPAPAEPPAPAQQDDDPDENNNTGRSFLSSFF